MKQRDDVAEAAEPGPVPGGARTRVHSRELYGAVALLRAAELTAGDRPRLRFKGCALALLVVALSACGGPPLLVDIVPVAARLESDQRVDVGVIGSVGVGGGTMLITADDGRTFRVPVSTHGVGLGALMEASGSQGVLELDLSDANVPRATDLFTHYEGSRGEIVLAIGASYLELESEFDARLSGWLLGFGTSLWAGRQWLFIEPAGEVIERDAQEL